jgi:hypothetical protein
MLVMVSSSALDRVWENSGESIDQFIDIGDLFFGREKTSASTVTRERGVETSEPTVSLVKFLKLFRLTVWGAGSTGVNPARSEDAEL